MPAELKEFAKNMSAECVLRPRVVDASLVDLLSDTVCRVSSQKP